MVKLRPQRQLSVTSPNKTKLVKHSYGPLKGLEHIGIVAYKLLLSKDSRIHPIFHCSLLKPFRHDVGTKPSPLPLPRKHSNNRPIITPLIILNTRWVATYNGLCLQVLVQWADLLVDDTSQEDWVSLNEEYHLQDNVIFKGAGSDRLVNMHEAQHGRPQRKVTPP